MKQFETMSRRKKIILLFIAVIATVFMLTWLIIAEASQGRALTVMQEIFSVQRAYQGMSYRDIDKDGVGEYGTLPELFSFVREFEINK